MSLHAIDERVESAEELLLMDDGDARSTTANRSTAANSVANISGSQPAEGSTSSSSLRDTRSLTSKLGLSSLFSFGANGRRQRNKADLDESGSSSRAGDDEMNRRPVDVAALGTVAGVVARSDSRGLQTSCSASVDEQSQSVLSDDDQVVEYDQLSLTSSAHQMAAMSGADSDGLQQTTGVRRHAHLCSQAVAVRKYRECPLCFLKQPTCYFPRLSCCAHRPCKGCLVKYLQVCIMDSRVQITCPECPELLHPSDIYASLADFPDSIEKFEIFSLRRALVMDPDTRWCPAPDCTYAVIASSCAACPQLRCERPGCGTLFCYHCKGPWHASQTCDEARRERGEAYHRAVPQIASSQENTLKRGDIKACPRCRTYIVKMNDGSCNHMICAMCNAQFCWLCLREINDLHYLSPTGCTFWGKKPWTRKKKLLWQVGTLIGAPVGIALIAGLAIPGIVFGVPLLVGRKVNQRFTSSSKARRRCLTIGSVVGSFVVSPVLAVMAVGVGVPIMLAYVYGVVPLSLCRNGGCGVGNGSSRADRDELDDDEIWQEVNGHNREKSPLLNDTERQDGTSVVTGISMNSGLSCAQQLQHRLHTHAESCRRRPSIESGIVSLAENRENYEEASTKALAGSQYNDDKSVQTICSGQEAVSYCEELASTVALAGSVIDSKSLTDSVSGKVFVSQTRDRDLSPSSQHAAVYVEFNKGDDRISANHPLQVPHDVVAHIRDDPPGTVGYKRRARATSVASAASGGAVPHRLAHTAHHNGKQLLTTPNVSGDDSAELMLMSEEAAMQLSGTNANLKQPSLGSIKTSSQTVWPSRRDDSSKADADRFHIRAIFDTMKRIVSDDVAVEPEIEPSSLPTHPFRFRTVLRRQTTRDAMSSSSDSHSQIAATAQANIEQRPFPSGSAHSVSASHVKYRNIESEMPGTSKRRFLTGLFSKRRK